MPSDSVTSNVINLHSSTTSPSIEVTDLTRISSITKRTTLRSKSSAVAVSSSTSSSYPSSSALALSSLNPNHLYNSSATSTRFFSNSNEKSPIQCQTSTDSLDDSLSLPSFPLQLRYQHNIVVQPATTPTKLSFLENSSKLPQLRLDLNINYGIQQKLVFLGDKGVGKSALIQSILQSYNSQSCSSMDTIPTILPESYCLSTEDFNLVLVDTPGDEELDRLRIVSYEKVDVWVLCFSLTSQESLRNIVERWLPEIEYYNKNLPIVLVACQSDYSERIISYEEVYFLTFSLFILHLLTAFICRV